VELSGMVKRYGQATAVDGLSLTAGRGEVTAILGPNGAGKTTLVKAAAALVAPQVGAVRIGDRDVAALDPRERARLIGYLPQDASVHWNIAAGEVVALGRLPHRPPFAGRGDASGNSNARSSQPYGGNRGDNRSYSPQQRTQPNGGNGSYQQQRQYNPPSRNNSAPSRSSSPPNRSYSAPSRSYPAPSRSNASPAPRGGGNSAPSRPSGGGGSPRGGGGGGSPRGSSGGGSHTRH